MKHLFPPSTHLFARLRPIFNEKPFENALVARRIDDQWMRSEIFFVDDAQRAVDRRMFQWREEATVA